MSTVSTMTFKIRGVSPLILNNGHTADPLNVYCKKLKELNSVRNKTDEHYEKISRMEWESCFYFNDKGLPIMPSENIEAMLRKAAAKAKSITKSDLQASCWVDDDALIRTGQDFSDLNKLYQEGTCVFRKLVRVNSSRVVRTRPIFFKWGMTFKVTFLNDMVNQEVVKQIVDTASYRIGMGDWAPKFGRFEVQTPKSE